MYVDRIPNRNSPPAVLLREGKREGGKVRKRTLANLSRWPEKKVLLLERLLADEELVPADELFSVTRSLPHGHVEAVLGTIRRLGLADMIASKPCRERDVVMALVVEKLLHPGSELAMVRSWQSSTLGLELGVEDADTDEVYEATDWLLRRQRRIEKKLAGKHLKEGGYVFYDVTSSYYYGRHCSLAKHGHSRDGKKGVPIIVYGVLTDDAGRPIAVDVYPGNTADPATLPQQVEKVRKRFGLERVVLVGDRGMLTQTQIEHLREFPQLGYVSALRGPSVRKLVEQGAIQMSLFDKENLAEIRSEEFPGERLVVCYNPSLSEDRRRTREDLLAATERKLKKIAGDIKRRTRVPLLKAAVGLRVGKVINAYKVAKHFVLDIGDNHLSWKRNSENIQRESSLDGLYVIRTKETPEDLSAEDAVRTYKGLAQVEQAFRTLKSLDLRVRPIYHRIDNRVRAHIFLSLLAYYVEWHMRKALAPLLFQDEDLEHDRRVRDPVTPAKPSLSARVKKAAKTTSDALPVHSFATLLDALATRVKNFFRFSPSDTTTRKHLPLTIHRITELNPLQRKAFELLDLFPVNGN